MQITKVKTNSHFKTVSYIVKVNNENICQLEKFPKNYLCGDKRFIWDLTFFKNSYGLDYYMNKARSIKEITDIIERKLNNTY